MLTFTGVYRIFALLFKESTKLYITLQSQQSKSQQVSREIAEISLNIQSLENSKLQNHFVITNARLGQTS